MHGYIARFQEDIIFKHLSAFPAVALLGARQVGKSTLAKRIIKKYKNAVYLDLEDPRDYAKLREPMTFLEANSTSLICIDEVQMYPEIFRVFRPFLDITNRPGQLLLLGSASRDLIRQSSESLAGRISYLEIPPFTALEANDQQKLWLQGGYPDSYIFDEEDSFEWRINYIRTFLERDIPQLGFNIPPESLKRIWTMLAHVNGNLLNQSILASSLGVSVPTVKRYLDILEGTFIIRKLRPYHANTKKRLVKSPKIYIRDTGLIHCLLGIESYNDLLGHPCFGNSYEAFIISTIIEHLPRYTPSFYRSSNGAEIDLIMERGLKKIAIEIKSSQAPKPTKGFYNALEDIAPEKAYVIAPIEDPYPIRKDIWVHNVQSFLREQLSKK